MSVELGNNGSQLMLSVCLHTDTESGDPISIPELGRGHSLCCHRVWSLEETGDIWGYVGGCNRTGLARSWDIFQQYSLSTPVSRCLCV